MAQAISKMERTQTAVQWLIEKQLDAGIGLPKEWREQAKQMEKEQICNAFDKGWKDEMRIGEEYYNETYNK